MVDAMRNAGIDTVVLASSDSLLGGLDSHRAPSYVRYFRTVPLDKKTMVTRMRNNFSGASASIGAARKLGDFDLVICTTPPLL